MNENMLLGGMPVEGKRGNCSALAVTLTALGALLLCSQAALESARAGLNLCAQMIVPSLLPFFILSSLLQQLGLPGILGRWLSPVTQQLFGIGGAGASALLLGVTGGYPLGAEAVARLRRSGTARREVLRGMRPEAVRIHHTIGKAPVTVICHGRFLYSATLKA